MRLDKDKSGTIGRAELEEMAHAKLIIQKIIITINLKKKFF